ncbi:Pleckstrin homology-like domain [Plasmopara halstedii]|uniref:Serine/threonine-protein phosphatase PGAM5, mitochondrial n=1 Tax=Plasmopara halstedii TaxID=4781 RepID=A0A0P1A3S1_PLAHL|nr:Pleckstrin homology-like domain [Plasmopara halstedii]CEG35085.1 Pleckstrin homology-like domain [Plasmopara halstedii]|eukprot:XP_024571454.1 Pleckstrin homology-like domain [Plasmopara halstedii]
MTVAVHHREQINHSKEERHVPKSSKVVRFANMSDLENHRQQMDPHYRTPSAVRAVPQNGYTTRRFTIDEVELYFSEDRPDFPMGSHDYAVKKTVRREDFVLCGYLESRRVKLGITTWHKSWAELFVGILVVRKYQDTVQRKRTLIPVSGGKLKLLNLKDNIMQIDFLFQGRYKTCVLRYQTKQDMFLWWWSIQVAAYVPIEPHLLHKCMSQPTLMPQQIADGTNEVGNVLFPRSLRSEVYPPNKSFKTHRGVVRLIFIRHGETQNINFRVCDRDKRLTKRGEEQAKITAKSLNKMFFVRENDNPNVTLIYGGLRRTVETAAIFVKEMPWLAQSYECCLLEDGAPKNVDIFHRYDYRESMHKMAFHYICRSNGDDDFARGPKGELEKFMLVIAHTSFIQYCMAQSYKVSREIIQLGAPICHCSVTRFDVKPTDELEVKFSNRIAHLPLTHQTSE